MSGLGIVSVSVRMSTIRKVSGVYKPAARGTVIARKLVRDDHS
jgi:hypothetical protein